MVLSRLMEDTPYKCSRLKYEILQYLKWRATCQDKKVWTEAIRSEDRSVTMKGLVEGPRHWRTDVERTEMELRVDSKAPETDEEECIRLLSHCHPRLTFPQFFFFGIKFAQWRNLWALKLDGSRLPSDHRHSEKQMFSKSVRFECELHPF